MDFAVILTVGALLTTAPLAGHSGFHAVDIHSHYNLFIFMFPAIGTSTNHPLPSSSINEILKVPFSEEQEDNELIVDQSADPANRNPWSPGRRF
jgi:hypothetical protein